MIIETITLSSNLCVTLLDQTCHYFGGYYHVKVLIFCDIPLEQSYFENDAEFQNAVEKMENVLTIVIVVLVLNARLALKK